MHTKQLIRWLLKRLQAKYNNLSSHLIDRALNVYGRSIEFCLILSMAIIKRLS